ncbi:solute carrier family 22 member 21-like [Haemaphysalis longicornis]
MWNSTSDLLTITIILDAKEPARQLTVKRSPSTAGRALHPVIMDTPSMLGRIDTSTNVYSPRREGRHIPFGEGRYQLMLFVNITAATLIFVLLMLSFSISTRVMDHWCSRPDAFSNLTVDQWKELAVPQMTPNGSYSRCTVRDPPDGGPSAQVVACSSWEFDLEKYGSNIVSEWNLVCNRSRLLDLTYLASSGASIIALPIAGMMADSTGRQPVTFVAFASLLTILFVSSLWNNFVSYLAGRIVVAVTSTALVILYVILYEVSSKSRKLLYCILVPALSTSFVPPFVLFVSLLRLGSAAMKLVTLLPATLLFSTFYLVDESPIWLMCTLNMKQAERDVLKAARINGVPLSSVRDSFTKEIEIIETQKVRTKGRRRSNLVCSSELLGRTILLAFTTTTIACVYSCFVLNRVLGESYSVTFASYLVTGPAYLLFYPLLLRLGIKRSNMFCTFVFAATSATITTIVPNRDTILHGFLVIVLRLSSTLPMSLNLLLAVSMYPILARAMGTCTCFAFFRLGALIAKLSLDYITDSRRQLALAIAAGMMIVTGAVTEWLPDDSEDAMLPIDHELKPSQVKALGEAPIAPPGPPDSRTDVENRPACKDLGGPPLNPKETTE